VTGYPLPFGFADVAAFLDRSVDLEQPATASRLPEALAGLEKLALPPGTPVVVAMSNGRPLLEYYFGALLLGLVPVLVSPAAPSARIDALARRIGAGAVVAARLVPHRYGVPAVLPLGDAQAVVLPRADPPHYLSGCALMLTSGTSGLFSGCLHRVDSLVRNARRHAAAVGLHGGDTVLVNLPLYYSYAIVAQALAALVTGARLVISGPPFAPTAYQAVIRRHGVTMSSVTPTIARLLLAHRDPLPNGLRVLTVGGDSLAGHQVGTLLSANPGLELYVTYGLTEAGPRVATLAAHEEPAGRYGSVGLPLAGVATALRPVPGQPGATELLVTSDTVLLAKVGAGSPERTLVAPGTIATGDLFHVDEDGYLFFGGRLSDFVVLRGEKVSLAAVRRFVQSIPGVIRCSTVVGDDGGHFDLDVRVAADLDEAQRRIRDAVRSFLLPGERPRRIAVAHPDLAVFQK